MVVYASLLSKIPITEKNWQIKSNVPSVASVKISDIEEDRPFYDKEPLFKNNFLNKLATKIKNIYAQKRIEKLENIPEESRTPVQKAEIEANKQSLDYVV